MVQRKVPNKLGVQAADQVKSEKKWLGNLKPNSNLHQDGKSRGPDMKKKMKKSRSIKLTHVESLQSSPLRKTIPQPGKPPPLNAPAIPATPKKQPVSKTTVGSPNYMKSTSSSEARMSSETSQSGSHIKNLSRRSSNGSRVSSASGGKPLRTLTRSSSLKRVRTLTKTPSFKPVRATVKKSSRVALCTDFDVQRATCSSTQKDSKFPAYLMLNPGGTEVEGTSAMKVCPYTYCSLNGHHKSPPQPLKCFLKARRRSLKTQKSMKFELLSPRRAKPQDDEHVTLDVKMVHDEVGLSGGAISPVIQEVGTDFFIEVYARNKEEEKETTNIYSPEDREGTADFARDDNKSAEEDFDKEAAKCLFDGSRYSEIDFDMYLEKSGDIVSIEMNIGKDFSEESKVEDASNNYSEGAITGIRNENKFRQECDAGKEEDESNSEITEMEWEEGQYSVLELVTEANDAVHIYEETAPNVQPASEAKHPDFHEDHFIISADTTSTSSGHLQAEDVLQYLLEDERASFDMQSDYSDSDSDGIYQNWEFLEFRKVCDGMVQEVSPTEEACKETTTMDEEEVETYMIGNMVNSTRETIMEPTIDTAEVQENGVAETEDEILDSSFATKGTTEGSSKHQENGTSQDDDAKSFFKTEDSNSPRGSLEADQDKVDCSQLDDIAEDCILILDTVDGSLEPKSDGQWKISDLDITVPSEEDQGEANTKNPSSMQSNDQSESEMEASLVENSIEGVEKLVEKSPKIAIAEMQFMANTMNSAKSGSTFSYTRNNRSQNQPGTCGNNKWTIRYKERIEDTEEQKKFNPREPNFLPEVPEPEGEKVDLRHQMMDDRKNAEEYLLDYALQRAVTKLAPARKRKVALLVEAFETVTPATKCETPMRHASAGFAHTRSIQACS